MTAQAPASEDAAPGTGQPSQVTGVTPGATAKAVLRARALLESPAAPLALGLLALGMSLPSLRLGLQLDDRAILRLFGEGRGVLEVLHESAQSIAREKQLGVFPWWTGPGFSIHFLRPLASLSHLLEYRLWPTAAWAMHLSNCVIYACLVGVAALLYRELLPSPAAAGLAGLMFAVDDSHAANVGWIAARHTLLASLFGLLAVLCHVRARERGRVWLEVLSVAFTGLTLVTAEFGLAALAYLAGYALVLDSGSLHARLLRLSPHALLVAAWLALYTALGCGVHDASWYRDPAAAPVDTLLQGVADLPLWLLSQLGGDVANAALVLPQALARVLALLAFVPVWLWLAPTLRVSRAARFCGAGMLLSLVPLFSTVPQDRLTLAASFGGFGWIACFMTGVTERSPVFARSGVQALRVPHLFFAPLGFIPLLGGLSAVDSTAQALARAVPERATSQAIVVNLPVELLTNIAFNIRQNRSIPLHQLYAGFSELSVARLDDRTLEITSDHGWGSRPLERLFTARRSMPGKHATRMVGDMRATVMEVNDAGLPARVRFQASSTLDAAGRVWLVWRDKRPVPWRPPRVGERVELDSPSMLGLLW